MRVTDRMLFDRAVTDGGAARARLEAATARAATGLKLQRPADDPAGAGLVTQHRAVAERAAAIAESAGRAADELSAVDGAIEAVANLLARAREITMVQGSDGVSGAERVAAGTEVKSLFDQIIGLLNTKVGGRYIFSGTLDANPPFDAAGNYAGDQRVRTVEVAPGVQQAASVRADQYIKGVGGGIDLLGTLTALRTSLVANNQTTTALWLGSLATCTDQVANMRQQIGLAMSALDTAVTVNQVVRDAAVTSAAHLTDADAIQANTELALAQRALEAALTATAKGFKLSLLDFLP